MGTYINIGNEGFKSERSMNKPTLLFLLLSICLSANAQTEKTIYLDKYELSSPELCQILKKCVIEQLSDDDLFCDIGAKETEKGTRIWVTANDRDGIDKFNIDRVKGYMMLEGHRFLIFDDPQTLPVIKVKQPILKFVCKLDKVPIIDDGAKEWAFLISDNQYYLIWARNVNLDGIIPMNDKPSNNWLRVINDIFQKYPKLRDKLKKEQ